MYDFHKIENELNLNIFCVGIKIFIAILFPQTLSEEKAALPLDEIWKNADPDVVVDKKLLCQFEVPAPLLKISPDAHLTFKGPFNDVVTSILTLQNITKEKVINAISSRILI